MATLLAGVLLSAGLVGIVGVAEVGPAGAAVVNDQPLSAVGSPMWQTNNTVWALDAGNNVVYAGGEFTSVRPPGAALGTGEVARSRIAAFNATTGALITSFNPNANGMVYDVDVSNDGTKLYVAGSFTTIGGVARQRIARLNLPSGTVDTGWSANANAIVATVTSDNNGVYVGGDFTTIKNVTRTRIAKLNTTNGDVVTAFNASSDKRIAESAIAPNGTRLLVGGENDVVNGLPQAGIASLDPTTGATMPWAATGVSPRLANGGCDANLTDIIISGTIAYVTAEAPSPGCWEGYYAANISDGSLIYNERCLGGSAALAVANGWVYRGSHNHDCSKNVGGYVGPNNSNNFVFHRLEAHRISDGRLGHWSPNTDGGSPGTSTTVGPQVMATDGTQLFVGGDQSQLNGQRQQGLARFGPTGGNSAPEVPTTPRVTATAAGTLSISAEAVSDDNDGVLNYSLYRDGGASPIATTTAESWPWSKPVLHFTDSGLTAGTSHSYQLTASDGTATSIRGPANVPVTVGWQNPPDYPAAMTAAGGATAHWRLDDGASPMADSSGNSNTGDIVGGVATGQPGAELDDTAITTNGTDGFVTSSAPITPTAAFTESVWFKTTTELGGAIMGFSDAKTGAGTLDNRAIWMDNDGKIGFGIRRGNITRPSNSFVRSLGTYNDGSWHQAAAVFDGIGNISLYLDGVLNQTLNVTQPILPAAGYLRAGYMDLTGFYTVFGSNYDGYPAVMSYYWQGSIDEAAMQNAALSAEQVAALYASGAAHGAPLPPEQADPGPPPPPPPPSAYPSQVAVDTPSMYWRLGELGQLPVADSSGNNRTGTYRNGNTYGQPGALGDDSTGVLAGGSGVAYSNQQAVNPQTYSLEAWVKTSSFNGGKILGLENARTGWGTVYDRQIYMTSNGRIAYGILAGGAQQVITSSTQYNDDTYHHVVATQGADGMALYVDGALIGTNPTVAPDAANGYWRLGGGNLTGWPNAPSSSNLAGTFDEVAVYPAALSAARIAAHFNPTSLPSAAPTNLHTTAVTPTSVALAWTAPAGTIASYNVYRDGALVGSAPATSFTDTGLTGGTAYSYTVSAVNSNALESPQTDPVVATTSAPDVEAPSIPADLAAPTVTGTSVALTWSASTDNVGVTGYELRRDGVLIASPTATSYTDLGVAASTAYSYTVLAKDASGNASLESPPLVVNTPVASDVTAPSVPANLHVVSSTTTQIDLAWDAATDDTGVTAYVVTRNGVDLPAQAGLTLHDGLLAPGATYTYTVRAQDGALNESTPSAPVVATTHTATETVFAAGSVWKYTDDGIDRGTAWKESAYDDSSWKSGPGQLGYGDGDEATVMNIGGTTGPTRWQSHYLRRSFTITGAANVTGATLSVLRDDGVVVYVNGVEAFRDNMPAGTITATTWPLGAITGAAESTYNDFAIPPSMLVEGTNVIAVSLHQDSRSGNADISFDASLTTQRDAGPPGQPAPADVHTTATTATTVDLAWTAPSGTITGYHVFRDGVLVGSPAAAAFNDSGLTSAQAYSYTVTAINSDSAESVPTAPLVVTTPDVIAPSVPGDLAAPTVNATRVILTWSPSTDNVGVTGYDVLRDGAVIASPTAATYTDLGVLADQTYSYTVRARDAAGNLSAESGALPVTTPVASADVTAPSVPQNLRTVSRAATSATLAWDPSADDTGVTGYIVSRNGVDLPMTPETTLVDVLLAPGASYTYTVRAVDAVPNSSAPSTPLTLITHLTDETIFPAGSVWKYTDDGIDRGTAWKEPAYDDSSWKSGAGQLGYGDGDEATVMYNGGTVAANRWISHYLRRSFTVADSAQITGVTLSILRDDGIVVYVNGVEAFRDNMPTGTITNTTFASSGLWGAAESTYDDFTIPTSMLHDGTNVIAVSLHQDSRSGAGDLSFDARLTTQYS